MRKYIITIMALLSFQAMNAQTDGCLIVKEFSPEWEIVNGNRHYFDMDDDGEWDFYYQSLVNSFWMRYWVMYARYGSCSFDKEGVYDDENVFTDINQLLNDSLLKWEDPFYGRHLWPETWNNASYYLDTVCVKGAIRNGQEGEYYYGWLEAYFVSDYTTVWIYLARTCFCTIPNYPLRWGQTSLTQDLEENESTAVASIYPNPANATVTIVGENLRQIEITDMLGQRVATHQAEGPQATIDISTLPTGIYFVGITDENGKRCVRKVVKE